MKLNSILLSDQEIREHSGAIFESEIPFYSNLPTDTEGIRFKLNKSMFRAETPEKVSTGKKLELHLGDITNLGFSNSELLVSILN